MAKTLTTSELEELRELIDAIDYRLLISNGIPLPTLNGEFPEKQLNLDEERDKLVRIRELLGLPLRNKGDRSHLPEYEVPDEPADEPLRDQLVKKGIEPTSYRNVRRVQEKRAAARKEP